MIIRTLLSLLFSVFLFGQEVLYTTTFPSFFVDSLMSTMTAQYRLDTANAVVTRDYAGANNLTQTGTIGYAQASISYSGGYGSNNYAGSRYFSVASPASNFNPGTNDFCVYAIIKSGSDITTNGRIISHYIHTNSGYIVDIASSKFTILARVSPTNTSNAPNISATTSYVVVANFDRSDSIKVWTNGALTKSLMSAISAGSIEPIAGFMIGVHSEGLSGPFLGSIEQIGIGINKLFSAKEVAEIGYKPEGWVGLGSDVTAYVRPNWQFALGFTGADTVYYGTALTTGSWSISIDDSAASGVNYTILTSADASTWTTLASGTTGTTWGTKSYSGTGSGYIGIAVASGTAYFDNLIVSEYVETATATGKFKGRASHPQKQTRTSR